MSSTLEKGTSWKLLLLAEDGNSKSEYNYVSAALVGLAKRIREGRALLSSNEAFMVATDALGSIRYSIEQRLENTTLFKTRGYTCANLANHVESTILPSTWTLTPATANILVDPLNIHRFPILNLLNSFEYMVISIIWKGYDHAWDNDNISKSIIAVKRLERTVTAFCIALVLTIKEHKHTDSNNRHYLMSMILERLEWFLDIKADEDVANIKSILSYFKSDAWCPKDSLSFVGSAYDVVLGDKVMTLLNDIIKEEYWLLLKFARGPNIALIRRSDANTKSSIDESTSRLENIIQSRQLTIDNFKVYHSHPFYVIWNFLTLMASPRSCLLKSDTDAEMVVVEEEKKETSTDAVVVEVTGRVSRHLLTTLLTLDMVPLLMCSICSSGLEQKLRNVRHMYENFVDKKSTMVKDFMLLGDEDNKTTTLEKIFRQLLERRWQGDDAPTGVRGARLMLQKKTAAAQLAAAATAVNNNDNPRKIQCDMYAFLSFYLLFVSSKIEDGVDSFYSTDIEPLFLGQVTVTALGIKTWSYRSSCETTTTLHSYSSCRYSWLLALVGIWALRNAIRVSNNSETYPLINFLSGVSDTDEGENLLSIILNHPYIKDVSLQNLEYAFAYYIDKHRFPSSPPHHYTVLSDDKQSRHPYPNHKNLSGIYIISKKHVEELNVDQLLNLETFPLTEYEIE
jgi:hypothetical protein